MCGRYYIADEEEIIEIREIIHEVNERYKSAPALSALRTGEIFPTDTVPILTARGGNRRAELMKWGFPRYDAPGVVINARAETAAEKPLFRGSVAARRCLIPSTGFFEWRREGEKTKKEKYLLRLPDDPMLYFAGIYNTFTGKDGAPYESFVILTTAANESVLPIHNRMPVLLTGSRKELWLRDDSFSRALLREPCAEKLKMELWDGQRGQQESFL